MQVPALDRPRPVPFVDPHASAAAGLADWEARRPALVALMVKLTARPGSAPGEARARAVGVADAAFWRVHLEANELVAGSAYGPWVPLEPVVPAVEPWGLSRVA